MEKKHNRPDKSKDKADEVIITDAMNDLISDDKADKSNSLNKDRTAVALSYDPEDAAPKVIASGKGFVADKIIQKARETDIPIHKDERLAHSLSKLEIGEAIPPELYDVVAEILVFVDKMDRIKEKVTAHEQEKNRRIL